jgi:hypothetical protein
VRFSLAGSNGVCQPRDAPANTLSIPSADSAVTSGWLGRGRDGTRTGSSVSKK